MLSYAQRDRISAIDLAIRYAFVTSQRHDPCKHPAQTWRQAFHFFRRAYPAGPRVIAHAPTQIEGFLALRTHHWLTDVATKKARANTV